MFWFNRYSRANKITNKLLVLIIAIFLTLLFGLAHAESGKIELEVLPTSTELPSTGKEVQVLVVMRNSTENALCNVDLSTVSDIGVKVKGNEQHLDSLPSNAEFAWNIKLSQGQDDLVSGKVHFRIDYAYRKEKNGQLIPRVSIKSLEVKSRKISPIDQIADVEVKTTLETLNENRPGIAHLVIKNKSDVLIKVEDVSPSGPNFICFENNCSDDSQEKTQDDKIFPKTLSPHKTIVIPIQIIAKQSVRPGKHLLLFDVLINWQEAGEPQKDHLVVTQEVDVGVLGESEILQLLGLPSFLLLPGFLIITTMGLLWNLGFLRLKSDIDEFPLKFNTPEFWLISITLSGLVAFGYMRTGRNYLDSYGLRDIASVWLFSIFVLGLGLYLSTMLGRNLYISSRTPSEKDNPITILKKLGRQKRGVYLKRVNLKIGEEIEQVFPLEPPGSSRDKLWVGPQILVQWKVSEQRLQQKIDDLIRTQNNKELANLLEQFKNKEYLEVDWKPIGLLNKPREVNTENISSDGSKEDIVDVEQE